MKILFIVSKTPYENNIFLPFFEIIQHLSCQHEVWIFLYKSAKEHLVKSNKNKLFLDNWTKLSNINNIQILACHGYLPNLTDENQFVQLLTINELDTYIANCEKIIYL